MKSIAPLLLAVFSFAHAGVHETCEEAKLGKNGWEYTQVPCPVDPEEVAKKKQCGKDYRVLRIGMTVERFEQCNESLSYVTDTIASTGVTESYRSTFYYIHVRGGKIVSYTRR